MDKRFLWHKIDPCEQYPEGKDWHRVELHATDAMHALTVDPDHWKDEKPEGEAESFGPAEEGIRPNDGSDDETKNNEGDAA
ncbi:MULTISPECIES: hypothetical protein [unclassified Bradyrhizobium]|uniref:hypothetical protein n=1 Tax=unclassified Bradyrhizobium TaxID=2631580 RepID=UPI00247B0C9F|nr:MULTISPECIES: hypothetical protein [unclassified Bradyrhizobium]WGR74338.1 hypothetical protein MTX24_16570 [Bradyrhizobium sp. ISRA426]WGR79173.1 hypothetical protein MTX21_01685 [Bradyrhizobium sp. ISRA430]WGR90594.1 hypothetical protein MTX25_39830 [Bradyrhizobium sp. ISRA432]